ncbi:tRNA dihydrouridine synthase DusB [bacterium]|nr:tRNA dihydrouridine synthase DusB [bacterium]
MISLGNIIVPGELVLAPLAGYTDRFFRKLIYSLGARVAFTEMISAEGIVRYQRQSLMYLDQVDTELATGVQIFGSRPLAMARASEIAREKGAKLIDINMGCPVKKIVRSGAGAALMKDLILAGQIMAAVRKAVDLPVLIKCRSGWDDASLNFKELVTIAAGEGIDAITFHPRTRSQNYQSPARWEQIKELVEYTNLPVIGNGDIVSAESAQSMRTTTGCYALMVGRAALRNPLIFKQYQDLTGSGFASDPLTAVERWHLIDAHLTSVLKALGPKHGLIRFRKFLSFYLSGLDNVCSIRARIFTIDREQELRAMLQDFLLDDREKHELRQLLS